MRASVQTHPMSGAARETIRGQWSSHGRGKPWTIHAACTPSLSARPPPISQMERKEASGRHTLFCLTSLSYRPGSSSSLVSCPRAPRQAAQPTPKILHMIPFCFMHPKWSALRWQGLQQIIAGESRRLGFRNQMQLYFHWLWGQGDPR